MELRRHLTENTENDGYLKVLYRKIEIEGRRSS